MLAVSSVKFIALNGASIEWHAPHDIIQELNGIITRLEADDNWLIREDGIIKFFDYGYYQINNLDGQLGKEDIRYILMNDFQVKE